ncbi:MAG: hypothetical protein DWI13_01720 [Planctomycetota bacterium]|jgi:DNA polymerase-3 subunit delta|nr:MAG: hypothetical protein DWI13_01720 [Planctomycetota bacterium]
MAKKSHASALDLLEKSFDLTSLGSSSLFVLVGDEPFVSHSILAMMREALCPVEEDRVWAWREFVGDDVADPRDVFDEAATVPLFSTGMRVVVVRSADAFVSRSREILETLAAKPRGSRGLIILEVKTFPSNTRLAKAVAKNGVQLETSIDPRRDLVAWIRSWALKHHSISLPATTAGRLLERLGRDLGQINQSLAVLAAQTTGSKQPIPPEAVDHFAGSTQERSAWNMIARASAGDAAEAIGQLSDLIESGENPVGLSAQASAVLRRLAIAARLMSLPPGHGRPAGLREALLEAGVAAWPKALDEATVAMRQLGPQRAVRLPLWLLETDRALKAEASRGMRSRLALERLICKMATSERSKISSPGDRSLSEGNRFSSVHTQKLVRRNS